MYEKKFLNHPDLVCALNRLGPEGLFDFFLPDLRDYVARYGDATMVAVRDLVAERIRPLYGKALRADELYRSIFTLWHDGGKEALRQHNPDEEAFSRFFAYLANHIWTLDNQSEEALRQIEVGEFDCYAIRRKHLAELGKDPEYVSDEFVRRLAREHGFGPRLKKLADISIGRIALKESRRDIGWAKRQSGVRVNHIADWLISAVATETAWLSNLDDMGRPKKLMKFGSLDAMHAEAEKNMKRALAAEAAAVASEEETFADEGGEYRIVRLTTARALDYESTTMRHCIGHGAYDRYLGHNDFLLLSLRDKDNRPHLTIQVNHRKIVQFSGEQRTQAGIPAGRPRPALPFRDRVSRGNAARQSVPGNRDARGRSTSLRGVWRLSRRLSQSQRQRCIADNCQSQAVSAGLLLLRSMVCGYRTRDGA